MLSSSQRAWSKQQELAELGRELQKVMLCSAGKVLLYARNTAGPSLPVQSAGSHSRPTATEGSDTGQGPRGTSHNAELLHGPGNTWGHTPGAFPLARLLVCSNYLTNRTLNQESATCLALLLVV